MSRESHTSERQETEKANFPEVPSYGEILHILRIINESATFSEFKLETKYLKIAISRRQEASGEVSTPPSAALTSAPSPPPAAPQAKAAAVAREIEYPTASIPPGLVPVRSSMVGVFYRAPSPGAAPFVEIGTHVLMDQQVGIIDVMKLMNAIKSPVEGTVRAILVEDGEMVEYGQVIMWIEPQSNS